METTVAFHPERLRDILSLHCARANCEALILQDKHTWVPGPLKAVTKAAAMLLTDSRLDDFCGSKKANISSASAEEQCFQYTLNEKGAKSAQEPGLLKDFTSSNSMPLCSLSAGAFAPFGAWPDYMSCLGQAGYSANPDPYANPGQVAWTRDMLRPGVLVPPRIFCWVLVQHRGEEAEMINWQRYRGLGVFACDGWMVVSNASAWEVLHGQSWHTNVTVIDANIDPPRLFRTVWGQPVTEPADSGVYAKAWKAVLGKSAFRDFDWVLKLDVNVVVVPERLRYALHSLCLHETCGGKKMVHNFGGDLSPEVEALSVDAASTLATRLPDCMKEGGWDKQPENRWLSSCVSTLGISTVRSSLLLSSGHKVQPRPCDTLHGAFGLIEDIGSFELCHKQTGYYFIEAPATSTRTSTSTRTTMTTTSMTSTSSTVSTTTSTFTIPKVAPNSIFRWEGRSFQKQLPVWVLTKENEQNGIPFAIQLVCALLLAIGLPVAACCVYSRSTPVAPPPAQSANVQESAQQDPLIQPEGPSGAASEAAGATPREPTEGP